MASFPKKRPRPPTPGEFTRSVWGATHPGMPRVANSRHLEQQPQDWTPKEPTSQALLPAARAPSFWRRAGDSPESAQGERRQGVQTTPSALQRCPALPAIEEQSPAFSSDFSSGNMTNEACS